MELAGYAAGGHAMTVFNDFDIKNAAELEAHINMKAIAAKINFDKYYAERLTDVSKLWVDQKRRLDVRQPFEVPTIIIDCGKSKYDFAQLVPAFEEARQERDAARLAREKRKAEGDTSADLEVDQRVSQDEPVMLKLKGVDYSNIDKAVAALLPCTVKRLDLSNCGLSEDDGEALCKLVTENKSIASLDLSGNPLNTGGIEKLAVGLKQNKTLTNLDLGAAEISKSAVSHLAQVLTAPDCQLQRLQLAGNKLGIYGAEALAAALKVNQSLRAVGLQNNNMGDDGIGKLLEIAFTGDDSNKTIVLLSLESNKASDERIDALAKVVHANDQRLARVHLESLEASEREKREAEISAEWDAILDLLRRSIAAQKEAEQAAAAAKKAPAAAAASSKGKGPVCATAGKASPAAAGGKAPASTPAKKASTSPVKTATPSKATPAPAGAPPAKAPAKQLMSSKVATANKTASRSPSPGKKK